MSGVEIKVELDTGATMGFERDAMHMGSGSPRHALHELDKGYKMIRAWLESQMPPATAAAPPEPEKRGRPGDWPRPELGLPVVRPGHIEP